jgi:hypothetical protein
VKVNDGLTFFFDDDTNFESHHYAFHVSDADFDAIFGRVKKAGLIYGRQPGVPTTGSSTLGAVDAVFISRHRTATCSS